jgi:GAF domain-containing protein
MPIMVTGECIGVLDVDSNKLDDFSATDADGLGRVVGIIETALAT